MIRDKSVPGDKSPLYTLLVGPQFDWASCIYIKNVIVLGRFRFNNKFGIVTLD